MERRRDNLFFTEEEEDDEIDDRAGGSSSPAVPPTAPAISSPSPAIEKEHMFEKVVTPSDVGKLNRLVIPKQHAEKYFPLDASTHDKGLLLNFEDRTGKPWRFRYSYWNSSQSYVMTKGWSRFVKEKRLDAGDTVSFGRGTGLTARHRLFIDWKRRPDPHLNPPASLRFTYEPASPSSSPANHPHPYLSFARSATAPWAAGRLFIPNAAVPSPSPANYFYFRAPPISNNAPIVLNSVPVAHAKEGASPKRVRLFGVNLEQPRDAGSSSAASSSSSSTREAKDGQHSPTLDIGMR